MAAFPRFFVIGCGSIGQRHIENLQTLGVVDIQAFDVRPDRRAQMETRFNIPTVGELEDGWASEPEVALITAPTSLHVPLALEAAEHGCHLFIEKPLGDSLDGVSELLGTVQDRNLKTMIGSNMRFHHGPATIKELLTKGTIGKIISAHMDAGQYLPDWHPWEDYRQTYSASASLGGGVLLDGIHEIDLARWIFGEVEAVYSQGGTLSSLEIATEDTIDILMRMTAGNSVSIHMDYVQRTACRTSKIIGEEGTIVWDINNDVRVFSASDKAWHSYPPPQDYNINQMYLEEMQHFLRYLSGEDQPTLDAHEATRVLEIVLAIKDSMISGDSKSVAV